MKKSMITFGLLPAGGLALLAAPKAQAGVGISISVGAPVPVVYAPPVVYMPAPAPIVYAPAPVVLVPAPRYYYVNHYGPHGVYAYPAYYRGHGGPYRR